MGGIAEGEVVQGVRQVWPAELPLTARLGVLEFNGSEDASIAESVYMLRWLKGRGLDLVDVGLALWTPDESVPWEPNIGQQNTVRAGNILVSGYNWRYSR